MVDMVIGACTGALVVIVICIIALARINRQIKALDDEPICFGPGGRDFDAEATAAVKRLRRDAK